MELSKSGESFIVTRREWFSVWPTLIGWLAMPLFAFHVCTHMVAAGDTWVAMVCGRHFANHGVDTVESFNANTHEAGPTEEEIKTWASWARRVTNIVGLDTIRKWDPTSRIGQNRLAHLLFYQLVTSLASEEEPYFHALVSWKFGIYVLAVALKPLGVWRYQPGRRRNSNNITFMTSTTNPITLKFLLGARSFFPRTPYPRRMRYTPKIAGSKCSKVRMKSIADQPPYSVTSYVT